jgi:phenylalanyl-tRNA synthetase beta chain
VIVTQNWLKEFVSFDYSPEQIAHELTMVGLEVEGLETIGAGLDSVIVAELVSVDSHPDAERLTVCQVNNGTETVQVVCGATNHRQGDLVALATVGSTLPGEFKIKKSKIRGQVSMGMLCSESELGLAQESSGIMILPEGLTLGFPVFAALGFKDVRFEIGLTPNRPDCLSVLGVAREIGAMTGCQPKLPRIDLAESGAPTAQLTSVTIDAPDLCPRYDARLIRGVKIGPSPEWLVRRLETVGMRSINNVVDVTNFVLMELGHPLHAFDFNLLRGKKIIVRKAGEGTRFTTLDGQARQLAADDLVICDAEGPVALAGIMGGENSEIQDSTVDVLLESAYFNPGTIRRTSKRLGIHSESSHRFERGADIDMVPVALDRAAMLIQMTAGGQVCPQPIDCYPTELSANELVITTRRTNAILGLQLTAETIKSLLQSIGLQVSSLTEGQLSVVVPLFRPDLEREIDLIEEVARLNGYDRIPVTMPASQLDCQLPSRLQKLQRVLKDTMIAQGFSEIINYSFISSAAIGKLDLPNDDSRLKHVALLNPLNEEQSIMRTTLVPSMLETLARNLAYRTLDLQLFELRPVFVPHADGASLGQEPLHLTAALTGDRAPLGWVQKAEKTDFYDLKGVVELAFSKLGLREVSWEFDAGESFLHPGKSARIQVSGQQIGVIGEIHPAVLQSFEINQPVYLVDLDVAQLLECFSPDKQFSSLSRYPDVFRDSAILVDEALPFSTVMATIERNKARFAEDVVLFDVYAGKGIPEGKKSLAFRVKYRSTEKTFTDEEINKAHGKIVNSLQKNLGAEIR